MNANPWFQVAIYLAILFALAWPLARWIEGVLEGRMAARWRWMNAIDRALLSTSSSSITPAPRDAGAAAHSPAFNGLIVRWVGARGDRPGAVPLSISPYAADRSVTVCVGGSIPSLATIPASIRP
ncbi:MAG TPA: hypothetical protein VJ722_04625 [Rhodanobacteraceae bacterium]|nr:hypothetical protein [Rhodanobacteraceae bacterium]